DAYLTYAAAQETLRAAQAGVARAEVLQRSVHALADAGLRPGADASRTDAELAVARTQFVQAQQAVEVAGIALAQFVGSQPEQVRINAPKLLQLPPEVGILKFNFAQNPIAEEQRNLVEQKKAEFRIMEKSYVPRLFVQGSAYSRGNGASTTGARLG